MNNLDLLCPRKISSFRVTLWSVGNWGYGGCWAFSLGFGSVFKMDYSAAIDAIRDQRLDFIEMVTESRKQLQVTIVELSITSPRMITSPDFALAFDCHVSSSAALSRMHAWVKA